MNTFTPERINQTLDVFRAFLRGERREPLLTVHAEYPSLADFCRELAKRECAQARYWFCVGPEWGDVTGLRRTIEVLEKR